MAEMIVNTPEVRHIVDEYDIVSVNGMVMPVTVDLAAGDTIMIGDQNIIVQLVGKPSLNDPKKNLPAEDIVINRDHIFSIQHRKREVIQMTPEQRFEWDKTFKELTNQTIQ